MSTSVAPSVELFDRMADTYDRGEASVFFRLGRMLVDFAPPPAGETVCNTVGSTLGNTVRCLDLGCGRGAVLRHAASHENAIDLVVGVDASKTLLGCLQSDLETSKDSGITATCRFGLVAADASTLGFPDRTFDRVYCSLLLDLVADPSRPIAEAHRVLKAGGTFAACCWHEDCPYFLTVFEVLGSLFPALKRRVSEVSRPETLQLKLVDQGFERIATREVDIRVVFEDENDWWSTLRSLGFGRVLDRMPPSILPKIRSILSQATRVDGSLALDLKAVLARGAR